MALFSINIIELIQKRTFREAVIIYLVTGKYGLMSNSFVSYFKCVEKCVFVILTFPVILYSKLQRYSHPVDFSDFDYFYSLLGEFHFLCIFSSIYHFHILFRELSAIKVKVETYVLPSGLALA